MSIQYPITITFDPTPWSCRFETERGIDLENEMYNAIVQAFQKLDPSLSAAHIRGEANQQVRHANLFAPIELTMSTSTKTMMELWHDMDIPHEFVYGLMQGAMVQLNRSKIQIDWN